MADQKMQGASTTLLKSAPVQESLRVGIMEIGSRALRVMVADVSEAGLDTVFTRAREVRIMAAVRRGAIDGIVDELTDSLEDFKRKATELGASRMAIFGTDAMRQISTLPELRGSPLMSAIRILDQEQEALCSLIGAIKGLPRLSNNRPVLVIDQGGGSVEIAVGEQGPPIKMIGFSSSELGGDLLLQRFKEDNFKIDDFVRWLEPRIEAISLPPSKIHRVISQGGVGTKYAWLHIRGKNTDERYDPRRVHGTILPRTALETMITNMKKIPFSQWERLRKYVAPQESGSDAFERLLTGVIALSALLKRLEIDKFTVSGYGTRHGMAWQLASELGVSEKRAKK
jgi:exopolyphosphatase/pppGpp-phosphohydrolase